MLKGGLGRVNLASRSKLRGPQLLALLLLAIASHLRGQVCLSADDLDAATRTGVESAAKRYFDMSAHGDIAGLRQNSIPSVASNFTGVENLVKENQANFSGAQATVRPPFELTAEGTEPIARAEFLCGVFGPSGQTSHSAVLVLHDLPPGKYAVVVLDVSGGKESRAVTFVLQSIGTDWKLAGYYSRPDQAAGHDGAWFAQRAREFRAKSQNHNAWLYYREAVALTTPVDFMSTLATDKLYDEIETVRPSDLPVNGNATDLAAAGRTYRLTEIFPIAINNDLDLVVKYSVADISNTQKTFEQNSIVIKALVAKFPEFRDAFAAVVARAVDPTGQDYGSLLPMKEIK
jgi:hypothetical protein